MGAMAENEAQFSEFLKRHFLFHGLSDDQIKQWADGFTQVSFVANSTIYSAGDIADGFFIVMEGVARLISGEDQDKREWDTLVVGDYFGEGLLLDQSRPVSAVAVEDTVLLKIDVEELQALLPDFPKIRSMLINTAESRRMARRQKIKWLGKDEAIYLIARKHEVFLFGSLIIPVIVGLVMLPLIVFGFLSAPSGAIGTLARILGILGEVFAVLLGIWNWLDWGNDYYIVTSQRVLWLEKVIGLYDSRQEAPLTTVLSKNVVSDQLGRILKYGNVIVKTFTGSIVMHRADHPNRLVDFIDGLQSRAHEIAKQAEARKMETIIRQRLGLEPKPETQQPPEKKTAPPPPRGLAKIFTNFLKVRYEVGDVITYRKHWYVLLLRTWKPSLVFMLIIAGMVILGLSTPNGILFLGTPTLFLWFIIFFGIVIWWGYHYVDWRNDIYVVTLDSILDIEKKPLSREDKKTAPLSNILSLENTREGIVGILLNVGTVTINVGIEKFIFHGVFNPAQVQYEIFDRMYALRRRKEEQDAAKERERLADWLTAYHRQSEILEQQENESDWDLFPG